MFLIVACLCLGISVTRAEVTERKFQATNKSIDQDKSLTRIKNQSLQLEIQDVSSKPQIHELLSVAESRNGASRMLMEAFDKLGNSFSNKLSDTTRQNSPTTVQYGTKQQNIRTLNPDFFYSNISPPTVEVSAPGQSNLKYRKQDNAPISQDKYFFGSVLNLPLAKNYIIIKRLIMYAFSVSTESSNEGPDTNYYLYIPEKRKQDLLPDSPLDENDYIVSAPVISIKDIFTKKNSNIPQPKLSVWGKEPKKLHQKIKKYDIATQKQIDPRLAQISLYDPDVFGAGSFFPLINGDSYFGHTETAVRYDALPKVPRFFFNKHVLSLLDAKYKLLHSGHYSQNNQTDFNSFLIRPNHQSTQPNLVLPRPNILFIGNSENNIPLQSVIRLPDSHSSFHLYPRTNSNYIFSQNSKNNLRSQTRINPQPQIRVLDPRLSSNFNTHSQIKIIRYLMAKPAKNFQKPIRKLDDESNNVSEQDEKSSIHTSSYTHGSRQLKHRPNNWPSSKIEIMPTDYIVHTVRLPSDALPQIQNELEKVRQVHKTQRSKKSASSGEPIKVRSGIYPDFLTGNFAPHSLHSSNSQYSLPQNSGQYLPPKIDIDYPLQPSIVNYIYPYNRLSYQLPEISKKYRIIGGRPSLSSGEHISTKVRSGINSFSQNSEGNEISHQNAHKYQRNPKSANFENSQNKLMNLFDNNNMFPSNWGQNTNSDSRGNNIVSKFTRRVGENAESTKKNEEDDVIKSVPTFNVNDLSSELFIAVKPSISKNKFLPDDLYRVNNPLNYITNIQRKLKKIEGVKKSESKANDQDKVNYRIIGGRPSLSSGEPINIKVRSGIGV